MKYRSKPAEVEAVRLDGLKSYEHMCEKWGTIFSRHRRCYLNGISYQPPPMRGYLQWAFVGDWIIKDGDTFSVMSDEEFKRKYDKAE